jgi:hypothetical protein
MSMAVLSNINSVLKKCLLLSLRGVRRGGRRSNLKRLEITTQMMRLLRYSVSRNDVHKSFSTGTQAFSKHFMVKEG